mmetsp:Transcript_2901/g.6754  ORF Transcript_2901/g.6754 Transcript_2901/m.6754 type:complete len:459 (-) Transcript_2901:95-1471(-)|eukprot:CAMPEP_0177709192 /NCGR_PEP_ID=MMETSP0484_2-20121128/10674_1 /TAXON_ID=354590 /ORGANISM="Rhodomonas lens, Strain RHODO" /LENGTH=458 /DNA_ID=CAMNT_0019220797 /DNA_START=279 /DNA_END=1655 /DNA_ORIENTATION=-
MSTLLLSGCTSWEVTGKVVKKGEPVSGENLFLPTYFAATAGLKFAKAFSGPMSCHSVCITEEGKCYAFGRNQAGQLGVGDLGNRANPTLIKGLEHLNIVKAACGKTHTLFLSSGGEVWVCGSNKFGELGIGKTSDQEEKPKAITSTLGNKVVDIGAGVEFSMIVTEEGRVLSFGHPEYGALGHGTDGKYIISTGREGFREMPTPTQIPTWHTSDIKGKDYLGGAVDAPKIKRVFCGNKHTLCLDEEGCLWSWGYNGYGRLGLNDPHDRKRPCKVDFFTGPHAIKNFDLVAAGGATSGAVDGIGQLYTWGQIKKVGESQVRPWICQDLSGWRIRSMSFGNESFAIAADSNKEPRRPWIEGCESVPHVITWGGGKYGELGYGPGKKSSANPDIVASLTETVVQAVQAGYGHTLYLLGPDADAEKFPTYDPPEDKPVSASAGKKRGASGDAKGAPAKKKKK